jgi:hypothetical protein
MLLSSKQFVPAGVKKPATRNVITKGGKQILFDTDQIQQLTHQLYQVKDQAIDKLTVQDKQALNTLQSYSQLLHDDPELDNTLRKIINARFKDHHTPIPGTAGAWAVGCLRAPRGPDQQCHILCANSMPCPKDDPYCQPCDKSVYWAEWSNGRYILTEQIETPSNDIWIWLVGRDQTFHGLDASERQILGNKKNVTVKVYNPQTQEVTDVKKTTMDDPSIAREKIAVTSRQTEVVVMPKKNGATGWIILAVILIVLLVALAFWKK